jgi:hypothetical protein
LPGPTPDHSTAIAAAKAAAASALDETKEAIKNDKIDEAFAAVEKVKAEYENIKTLITDQDNADLKFLKEQWESAKKLADDKKSEMVTAIVDAAKLAETRAKTAFDNKDETTASQEASNSEKEYDKIKKLLKETEYGFNEVKSFYEKAIEHARQTKEKIAADAETKRVADEKIERERKRAETDAAAAVSAASTAVTTAVNLIETTTTQAVEDAEKAAASAVDTATKKAETDAAGEKKKAEEAENERKEKLAKEQEKIDENAKEKKRLQDELEAAAKTAAAAAAATATQEAEQRRIVVEQAAEAARLASEQAAAAAAAAATATDEAAKVAAKATADIAKLAHEKTIVEQELEKKSQELKTKETELGTKIREKTGEFEALKIEKEQVDLKLARLQTEYDEVVQDRETKTENGIQQTGKIASLEASKSALEKETKDTKLIVDELKQKLKTATTDLGKEQGDHAALKILKTKADTDVTRLGGEKAALEGEKNALAAAKGALELEKRKLEHDLGIAKSQKLVAENKLTVEQNSLAGKLAAAEVKGRDDYIRAHPASGGGGSAGAATGGGGSAGAAIVYPPSFTDLTNSIKTFYEDNLESEDQNTFVMADRLIADMLDLQLKLFKENVSFLPAEIQTRLEYLTSFIFWPCRTARTLYVEVANLKASPSAVNARYVRNLQAWGQQMQRIAVDQYNTSKKVSEFYGGFYELNAPSDEQKLANMPSL